MAERGDAGSVEYRTIERRGTIMGSVLGLVLAISYLMVVRPSLWA